MDCGGAVDLPTIAGLTRETWEIGALALMTTESVSDGQVTGAPRSAGGPLHRRIESLARCRISRWELELFARRMRVMDRGGLELTRAMGKK